MQWNVSNINRQIVLQSQIIHSTSLSHIQSYDRVSRSHKRQVNDGHVAMPSLVLVYMAVLPIYLMNFFAKKIIQVLLYCTRDVSIRFFLSNFMGGLKVQPLTVRFWNPLYAVLYSSADQLGSRNCDVAGATRGRHSAYYVCC